VREDEESSFRAQLIIVTEQVDLTDRLELIEQPSPMAKLTIRLEPLPAWDGCGPLCPTWLSGGNVLA
jgi:hypothetical protein